MPELNEADIGATKPPFQFREDRNSVFYHDVRIFIAGADVTPWVTSAITLTYADRNSINSLSFELSNVNRAFEITEDNIGASRDDGFSGVSLDQRNNEFTGSADSGRSKPIRKFRLTDPYAADGMYSELAKATIFNNKVNSPTNTKHGVKTQGGVVVSGHKNKITGTDNTNDARLSQDSVTNRYPMSIGSLVFHKYDPVRFFVKNPLSTSDDEWVNKFTGYLDVKPFSQDYNNGSSVIRMTCQDIRLLMQHMRVNTNPATQTGNENVFFFGNSPNTTVPTGDPNNFFSDLIVGGRTGLAGHSLFGQSFSQSMRFLLLGQNRNGFYTGGVGKLTEGLVLRYDPNSDLRNRVMEKWNNIIQFGSRPLPAASDAEPRPVETTEIEAGTGNPSQGSSDEPFPLGAAASDGTLGRVQETYLTTAEMLALGRETRDGGRGSPDVARVHFLFPAEGAPLTNLVESSIVDNRVTARVEWSSRLELINQVCKSIDYQFYVTGSGDVVFEFPQYDFMPYDYNEAYNGLYTFENHIMSDNINDEGGTPISALVVTSRWLQTQGRPDSIQTENTNLPGLSEELRKTVYSNVLASRIGVHVETHSMPGISDPKRLSQYALIEFNKRLANFNKFDLNTSFRPYIGINRPIYHVRKSRMAMTENVTYTWRVRQDATLEMALMYTRRLEGDKFRFITGGERQPISYKTIFDSDTIGSSAASVSGQGVEVTPIDDPNQTPSTDETARNNIEGKTSNQGGS